MCIKKKRQVFVPSDEDRIREFLLFCDQLEEHPFVRDHGSGAKFKGNFAFTDGVDTSTVDFDEFHLESLLTRLRQFLFGGELFFVKDLRRSATRLFGETKEFREFYDKLWGVIKKPWPVRNIQVFKSNGEDVVAGFTFPELIEAKLYAGAIHSMHRVDPDAPEAVQGVPSAHIAVSKHLSLTLAAASLPACNNIFAFRMHVLRLARESKQVDHIPDLARFDKRCRNASC